jgi:trimeric autotransporter adhesin
MNAIFRTIFNTKTGAYVAVSEVAKTAGKSSAAVAGSTTAASANAASIRFTLKPISTSLLAAFGLTLGAFAVANPTGGNVTSGSATITNNGTTTTINQSSNSAIINWQNFSIGANETVNFKQNSSSSVALNRVIGSDPSVILGNLNANGKVFLVNGNGVVFGKGAQVNVGGLVASTRNISDADFNAGNYKFTGNSSASVINNGNIQTSEGGYVALLGATVQNNGSISAKLGTVALAAGDELTLDIVGDGLTSVRIDKGTLNALIENGGLIQANGGQVYLTAHAANQVLNSVVNNTGVIQAQTIENKDGKIILLADMQSGTTNVAGTLDASAPTGGNGGFIETSAANVQVADGTKVTTAAPMGKSGTWLIDPFDYTVAATGGNMTGATLSSNLGLGNVTIASDNGTTGTAGDVMIRDAVSWSANTLTLNAKRNINIYAPMNGGAAGKLALEYGQSGLAAGNGSIFQVLSVVNLANGQNFSTKLGSDGATRAYTVINSITDIQSMAIGGLYALGANVDASATASWNGGLGFNPIGTSAVKFTGILDGLGHSINGLTINRPSQDYVGLLGYAQGGARNIGLTNVNITGRNFVGALAGQNGNGNGAQGYTIWSYSTGSVTGQQNVGGLVGYAQTNIYNSYSTANVTGTDIVGGLAGYNSAFTKSSYATGNVTGTASTATGGVGGFFGYVPASGLVTDNYATGAVTGATNVGGFIGFNEGKLAANYSNGAVTGTAAVGGFAGKNISSATNVEANSTITTTTYLNYWDLEKSGQSTSATGIAKTTAQMLDINQYSIANVCVAAAGCSSTLGAGIAASTPNAPTQGGAGVVSFNNRGVWTNFSGKTAPLITSYLKNVTVTTGASTKEYDGKLSASPATYTSTTNSAFVVDMSLVLGTIVYGGTTGTNVGTYTATGGSGLYSTQQGYNFNTYATSGSQVITKKALTATATAANKVYDGTNAATASLTLNGLVTGETLGITNTATFNTADVATANTVTVNSITLANGAGGGKISNYNVVAPGQTAAASITPKALIATATATNKVYDGSTTAAASLTLSGLITGESLTSTNTASFNSKDVTTASTVTVNSVLLQDTATGTASNYSLGTGQTTSATITPKALTGTPTASNKAYDGTTNANASFTLVGLVGGENLGSSYTASFNSKDVATATTVTINNLAIADGSGAGAGKASNYSLPPVGSTTVNASITKKTITASATANNKVYDGGATATANLSLTGIVTGETLGTAFTGATFNSKDVATASTVNVTGISLTNGTGDIGNYSLASNTASASANITAKALTATATATNKVYDGGTTATVNLALNGLVTGETLTSTNAATFNSKDVLTANTVTVNSVTLADTATGKASNYSLTSGQTAAASMTKKALTATATAANKVYDGNTAATANLTLNGLVTGDSLTSTNAATFNSKDVATANTMTVNSVTLVDTATGKASNYSLAAGQTATANITAKALTATATASDKTFDGNNTATAQLALSGLVGSETLSVTNTATFNSSDPATANKVTVNTVALSDATGKASNYSLTAGQTATAKIIPVIAATPTPTPAPTPTPVPTPLPTPTPAPKPTPTPAPVIAVKPVEKPAVDTSKVIVVLNTNNPSVVQNNDADTRQTADDLRFALNEKAIDFNEIVQKNPTAAGANSNSGNSIKRPSIQNLTIVSTGLKLPDVK